MVVNSTTIDLTAELKAKGKHRGSTFVQIMAAVIKCADCASCLDEATPATMATVCCQRPYCLNCSVKLTGTSCPCGDSDNLSFQPCVVDVDVEQQRQQQQRQRQRSDRAPDQTAAHKMSAHGIIREPVQTCPLAPCTTQISKSTFWQHLRGEQHRAQVATRACPACTDAAFENEDMFVEHMIAIHISASVKLGGSIMVRLL